MHVLLSCMLLSSPPQRDLGGGFVHSAVTASTLRQTRTHKESKLSRSAPSRHCPHIPYSLPGAWRTNKVNSTPFTHTQTHLETTERHACVLMHAEREANHRRQALSIGKQRGQTLAHKHPHGHPTQACSSDNAHTPRVSCSATHFPVPSLRTMRAYTF